MAFMGAIFPAGTLVVVAVVVAVGVVMASGIPIEPTERLLALGRRFPEEYSCWFQT